MARSFANSSNHQIRVTAPGLAGLAPTTGSFVAVLRNSAVSGLKYMALFRDAGDTANIAGFACNTSSNGRPNLFNGTDGSEAGAGISLASANGWHVAAWTKAPGLATPRFHGYRFETRTFSHVNASLGVVPIADGPATGALAILGSSGGGTAGSGASLAMVLHTTHVLTDAEFESVAPSRRSLLSIPGLTFGVMLDQESITQGVQDFVGGGVQTSVTGTVVSTQNPPLPYGHSI